MKSRAIKTCLVVFAATLLAACAEEVAEVDEVLRPVQVLQVSANDGSRSRVFSGTSHFVQESKLSFKIAGTVVSLPVKVGDELQAGDLIAELSSSSQSLEVQRSQAALAQTQANERNAKASYDRIKGLYANNNASKNDLDAARANSESAAAQTRSARKALELARLNLSYTKLTTPIDCRVSSVAVEENENVNAGTAIAMTSCGNQMEVRLNIPASLIVEVKQGMQVNIRFSSIKDKVFEGVVTEVADSSGNNSSTFLVVVSIQGTHAELRAGLGAEVEFSFSNGENTEAFVIPLQALIKDQNGSYVYVAVPTAEKGQAEIQRRDVTVGELNSGGIAITTGLATGDRLVTAGVSLIHVGQIVLVD